MATVKKQMLLLIISFLIVLKEIFENKEIVLTHNFNYFIRDIFHKIFIGDEVTKQIDISQTIIAVSTYLVIYYLFFTVLSVNIESMKNILRFNSSGLLRLYYSASKIFGKMYLQASVIMFIVFGGAYLTVKQDFLVTNYLEGFLDLLKLQLIIFVVLLVTIILPLKRMLVFVCLYLAVISYVLYFNSASYIYIGIMYALVLVMFVFRILFVKIDV